MKFQIITELDEFKKIREAWDELLLSSDSENVYVTSMWLEATIENFLNDDELFIFCGWEKNALAGALPFKRSITSSSFIELHTYKNITGMYTGHFDFPVRNQSFETLMKLWAAFKSHIKRCDILELNCIHENALAHQLFKHLSKDRETRFYEQVYLGSDYICEIEKDWPTYLDRLGKKKRRNINLNNNRLNKAGTCSVEEVAADSGFDEKYELAKILEQKSWKGDIGSVRTVDYENFLKTVCKATTPYNRLHFLMLKIGDAYASFLLCMVISGYIIAIVTGYDKKYRYYSPGQHLFCEVLRHAHERGYKKVDLFYNTDAYKRELIVGAPVPKYFFRITSKTPRTIIYKTFRYVKKRTTNRFLLKCLNAV